MSFLYPVFLFALLVLAIPVIIHLFNFKRYKTLYFSNVQLLKRIKQESRKKTKLKQLLILTARLLAIASLVFAFSGPYIPPTNQTLKTARQVVSIYIDNSFSMKAEGEKGQLLEQAKLKAIEIANSYKASSQFHLLTSDFSPGHQFLLNRDQFIQQVTEIKESHRSPKLSAIYTQAIRTTSASVKKEENTLYVLSDFQKNSTNIESLQPDSTVRTYLLPFQAGKTNNLMVDSCWFEIPGRKIRQQEKLFVRIRNFSDQAYQNIPVRLTINDSLKAISNMNIAEQEELILELNYTNNSEGIQLCKIELDDYPIIYDNAYFLSYHVQGKLHALGISNPANNGSSFLKALFADDELISYDEYPENNVQISQFKNYQCIFLINNQKISSGLKSELISFVEQGGSLVIFPDRMTDYEDYNALLDLLNGNTIAGYDTISMGISEINYNNDLYRDVFKKHEDEADLPVINGSVSFSDQMQKAETTLLKFRNGKNALTSHSFGNGIVYTFAFPLDKQNLNFIRHIIFVPTVYNMVLNSGESQKYAYSIENNDPVILNQSLNSGELTVINAQTKDEFVTSPRNIGSGKKQLILDEMPKEAGHYIVQNGKKIIQSISYNFPRKESIPGFYTEKDLQKLIEADGFKQFQVIESSAISFSKALQDLNNGKQLWKYFIFLAILFLFCEIAIIRFWK
ncbi:MAG TPA: BatA domain-containing protein [Prolixibacteraceae bacterium]|nr:BatA domain-containing protein [Prolixibacteraceae bacterium]